jgi:hypothetical protein
MAFSSCTTCLALALPVLTGLLELLLHTPLHCPSMTPATEILSIATKVAQLDTEGNANA